MGLFTKKPAPNPPTRAQLAEDFRRRIGDAVFDAQQRGLTIYDVVRELNLRIDIIRNQWAATAPLGGRVP
jgi:hypothetical protein